MPKDLETNLHTRIIEKFGSIRRSSELSTGQVWAYNKDIQDFLSQVITEVIEEAKKCVEEQPDFYPKDVFAEPWEGWQTDIDELAKSKGLRIDNISAWYGRWARKNMKKEVLQALENLKK